MLHNAAADYFLATRLAAFLTGAAALTADFAAGLTLVDAGAGAAAGAATTFNAARWSRSVLISAPSLSLRSVSLAMFALIFAMVLAVLDTGAFLAAAFTTGLVTFAAVFVLEFTAALVATFYAVAIFKFLSIFNLRRLLRKPPIVARLQASSAKWTKSTLTTVNVLPLEALNTRRTSHPQYEKNHQICVGRFAHCRYGLQRFRGWPTRLLPTGSTPRLPRALERFRLDCTAAVSGPGRGRDWRCGKPAKRTTATTTRLRRATDYLHTDRSGLCCTTGHSARTCATTGQRLVLLPIRWPVLPLHAELPGRLATGFSDIAAVAVETCPEIAFFLLCFWESCTLGMFQYDFTSASPLKNT